MAQIKIHQQAIKSYIAKDSQKALQWTRQLFYEKSNKADTLLARKLCLKTQTKHINKINLPKGSTYNIPNHIASIFSNYFSSLYDHNPDICHRQPHFQKEIESYLKEIPSLH
ncbi:Hypothetical predicted protein [Pelobates cultripes]|uniref:Uncharacterized protein n=1 Tax=Pelobates cultripes TaxID=61616 RepID=A0AAD1RRK0_PELCU|nr:Hypothetical predicted protein [Pelobates cultripes]